MWSYLISFASPDHVWRIDKWVNPGFLYLYGSAKPLAHYWSNRSLGLSLWSTKLWRPLGIGPLVIAFTQTWLWCEWKALLGLGIIDNGSQVQTVKLPGSCFVYTVALVMEPSTSYLYQRCFIHGAISKPRIMLISIVAYTHFFKCLHTCL